ncbi:MAG: hypothetical protein LRY51_03100 [Geovibrio sp.]|nr:hypothetical protein [Geovibrio sp.]
MKLTRLFMVLIVAVSLFSGIVGCEGGCSDATFAPKRKPKSEYEKNFVASCLLFVFDRCSGFCRCAHP